MTQLFTTYVEIHTTKQAEIMIQPTAITQKALYLLLTACKLFGRYNCQYPLGVPCVTLGAVAASLPFVFGIRDILSLSHFATLAIVGGEIVAAIGAIIILYPSNNQEN